MDILPAVGCHGNYFRLCENSDSTFQFADPENTAMHAKILHSLKLKLCL